MSSYTAPPGPITATQALAIANKVVADLDGPVNQVVVEDQTVERVFGWVFFYTTRRYLETGNISDVILGNGPLVVHRADGSFEHLATSVPPQRAIEIYEQMWLQKQSDSIPD